LVTAGAPTKDPALHTRIYNEFVNLYQAAPGLSVWRDNFFQLLPAPYEKNKWPDSFVQLVLEETKDNNKDGKKGAKFWDLYKKTKADFNNRLNKRYVSADSLKSGQNESGMFDAARCSHWEEDVAVKKMKKSTGNADRYEKKKEEQEKATESKKARTEKDTRFSDHGFPYYWLAFVMYGLPAKLEGLPLRPFCSGGQGLSSMDRIKMRALSKLERRDGREHATSHSNTTASTLSDENPKGVTVTHKHVIEKAVPVQSIMSLQNELLNLGEREYILMDRLDAVSAPVRREIIQEQLDIVREQKAAKKEEIITMKGAM
jgi:hypothetical protein